MGKIKRLFFDIETSPNVVYSWSIGYNLNISYENIIKERAIICLAYKWADEKETHALQWDEKTQCDKKMLQQFAKLVDEADEVIGHNGDNFDLKWLRTRCLFHGIELPPQIKSIDTLKLSKEGFRFNSNRLDYISKFLGLGEKIKTEFQLWKDVMAGKRKALLEMVRYNRHDVVLLEKVFNRLESYGPLKTHVAVLNGGLKSDCPKCGSVSVQRRGQRVSAAGRTTQRLSCNSCRRMYSVPLTTLNSDNKHRSKKI